MSMGVMTSFLMGLWLWGLNKLTGDSPQNSAWHVTSSRQTLAITTAGLWNLGAF